MKEYRKICAHNSRIELVVVLPHSNAGEERLFSMVRKNKTDSRSAFKLEGTLSTLLAMKLQYPEDTSPQKCTTKSTNEAKNTLKQINCRCCFY